MGNKFSNTHPLTIREVLSEDGIGNNKKMLSVPVFQRNYDWRSEQQGNQQPQVGILLQDLLDKWHEGQIGQLDDSEYLLGPMVIIDDPHTTDKVELLDGQQRLATITMILCAARDIILDLYTDAKCSSDNIPSEYREGWSNICDMTERKKESATGHREVHDNWKFELNRADRELFIGLMQEYQAEHTSAGVDQFCETQSDDCRRVDLKSKFISDILSKKKEDQKNPRTGEPFTKSEILLMQAYKKICEKLNELLITGFETGVEGTDEIEVIDKKTTEWLKEDMRLTPGQYGLDDDFFNDSLYGLDALEKNDWNSEEKEKLDNEFKNWKNKTDRRKDSKFENWIDWKIRNKKKKTSSRPNYTKLWDDAFTSHKNKIMKNQKKDNVEKLLKFCRAGIGTRLFSVRVMVSDDADAFQIFETLNSKGQELSKNSLVKNWVLKKIKDEDEQEKWNSRWEIIFNKKLSGIGNENTPDDFIRESLRSRPIKDENNETVFDSYQIRDLSKRVSGTKHLIYQIIKSQIQSSNTNITQAEEEEAKNAKQYIRNLEEDVRWYVSLEKPVEEYPDDETNNLNQSRDSKAAIMDLNTLGATHIRLPILAARRKWKETSDEYKLLVKFLVPFFFRYKTIEENHNAKLEAWMLKICRIIEDEEQTRGIRLIVKIIGQLDDSEKFDSEFLKRMDEANPSYQKYALHKITEYLDSKYQDTSPRGNLEQEHIFPQSLKLDDSGTPTKNWDMNEFFEEITNIRNNSGHTEYDLVRDEIGSTDKYKKDNGAIWINKLGNHTLLIKAMNGVVSNSNFNWKLNVYDDNGNFNLNAQGDKAGYNQSDLSINKNTVVTIEEVETPRTEWTAMSILRRGDYFSRIAKDVWGLPRVICIDESCPGHKENAEIDIERGDRSYKDWLKDIDEEKCRVIRDSGNRCGKELRVVWPKKCTKAYLAPSTYRESDA